jgi:excinuclease ABC subunit A
MGLGPGHFSFNVAGGRCETCEGAGQLKIELQFLADLYVVCEACAGRRYQDRILGVPYRTKSIHDVLSMTVTEAVRFFADARAVSKPLWQLDQVGLGYLRLGQPATTLSGGEAQRLKIALHLAREVKGECLFILDEPTTGLHLRDVGKLLKSFERLIGRGHSVLVVEHNLDVIARADWILDLGPEGGGGGGRLVVAGTPDTVTRSADSITGRHLAAHLARWGRPATKPAPDPRPRRRTTRRG